MLVSALLTAVLLDVLTNVNGLYNQKVAGSNPTTARVVTEVPLCKL